MTQKGPYDVICDVMESERCKRDSETKFLEKGVSGGPEFVSAIHLRQRRFISTAVQAAASSQSRL